MTCTTRSTGHRRPYYTMILAVLLALALSVLALNPANEELPSQASSHVAVDSSPPDTPPVVVDYGQVQEVAWFWDWQTCIWGIGLPTALAIKLSVLAPYWYVIQRFFVNQNAAGNRGINAYIGKVYSACGRFLRS